MMRNCLTFGFCHQLIEKLQVDDPGAFIKEMIFLSYSGLACTNNNPQVEMPSCVMQVWKVTQFLR